ncbi:MAG: porphobilinogen synthase [Anaerorhabdus sp.]
MSDRMTRLRRNSVIRNMVKRERINMDNIIYPVFLVEGNNIKREIPNFTNQYQYSIDMLVKELDEFKKLKINKLLLFASIDEKSDDASSGYKENGVIANGVKAIKEYDNDILVIVDVCLCQYKEDGHCCIFKENNEIDQEETLDKLCKIALSAAVAGADMVAPSDMMDKRVKAIRETLDANGFDYVSIMSYSAKYASAFYGPFRSAANSSPKFSDRKFYQMDPANSWEATSEIENDILEGADIVMVKPAMNYLDIIKEASLKFNTPIAAYQVSGEYEMIQNAIDNNVLSERAIYESIVSIFRAGATIVITYFAKDLQRIIDMEEHK